MNSDKVGSGCGLAIMVAMALLIMIGSFSNPNKKTDGVYESATEKLDKGLPLNDREKQRLNDILNYDENERIKEIERKHGEY